MSEHIRPKDTPPAEAAPEVFPPGTIVYLIPTRQFAEVERAAAIPDHVRLKHIGVVPIAELRRATPEEVRALNT